MTLAHRPMQRTELETAAGVLSRAFLSNPIFAAALSHIDAGKRLDVLLGIKRGFVRAALRSQHADVITNDGQVVAAALSCHASEYPVSLATMFVQGTGCIVAGPRALWKFLMANAAVTPRHLTGPHHYLFELGVDPPMQAKGVGRRLLDVFCARADREHLPCYLETDRETSMRLYRSVGFAVVGEYDIPRVGDVHMWSLVRPASAAET